MTSNNNSNTLHLPTAEELSAREQEAHNHEHDDEVITSGVIPVPAAVREAAENLIGHASVAVTTLNVLCTVVGGAVLALPAAIERMSFIPGCIFMGITCFLSWFAVTLVSKACARTGLMTFQDLVIHASNNNYLFVRFFFFGLMVFPIGIIIAFMKVIGESMPAVMKFMINNSSEDDLLVSEGFWILLATIILIPLSSFREMSELVWVSIIGFGTVLFTGISIVYLFISGRYTKFYDSLETPSTCTDWWVNHTKIKTTPSASATSTLHNSYIHPGVTLFDINLEDFFVAFPVMTMALTCHNNVPFFYGELRKRSEERMMKAVYSAGIFTTVFYLAVGISGYFVFGPSIKLAHGNVLNCMSWHDTIVMMCRTLMAIHFLCVFPINCIGARRVLNRIIYPDIHESKLSQLKLTLESTCLVCIAAIVAYEASGIEVVFSINGSLFGLLMTFALPSYCYIKLVNPCALSDFWKASRGALETSSVGSEEDQELGDYDDDGINERRSTNDGSDGDEDRGHNNEDEYSDNNDEYYYSDDDDSDEYSTPSEGASYDDDDNDSSRHHSSASSDSDDPKRGRPAAKKRKKFEKLMTNEEGISGKTHNERRKSQRKNRKKKTRSNNAMVRGYDDRGQRAQKDSAEIAMMQSPNSNLVGGNASAAASDNNSNNNNNNNDIGIDVDKPPHRSSSSSTPEGGEQIERKNERQRSRAKSHENINNNTSEVDMMNDPMKMLEITQGSFAAQAKLDLMAATRSPIENLANNNNHHYHNVPIGNANDNDDDENELIGNNNSKSFQNNNRRRRSSVIGDANSNTQNQDSSALERNVSLASARSNENNDDNNNNNTIRLHHHHFEDLAELTAPRQVREPSSLFWRISVWSLLVWGVLGTVCSFVFSLHALFSGAETMSAE